MSNCPDCGTPWEKHGTACSSQPQRRVPHKCPVCNGHKTVNKPPWVAGDQDVWSTSDVKFYPCQACNGTGIIWEILNG